MEKKNQRSNIIMMPNARLTAAEFEAFLRHAGELPLRRDMITLLTYVRDNKVMGTQSTGNMTLKHIREVTARFVNPPVLDQKIGDYVYKLRTEDDVWALYFLHVLAEVGKLLRTPRGKQWRLTKNGRAFLDWNPIQQLVFLLNVWWYRVNWLVAYPIKGMGEALPHNFSWITLSLLDALPVERDVQRELFADELIRKGGLRWHSQNPDNSGIMLNGAVDRMVIRMLESFGVITCKRVDVPLGNSTIPKIASFRITRAGKELLQSLKMIG